MGTIRYADGSLGTFEQGGTHNNTKMYANWRARQYLVTQEHVK